MNEITTGGRIGAIVAVFLYAVGMGMLFVMALNAVIFSVLPQPTYPFSGFPRIGVEERCIEEGGTWQGSSSFDGYCLTREEQDHFAQVARSTFVLRVSSAALGALALLFAFWVPRAGLLVRFGLGVGGVMTLSGVSGISFLFTTIPSQAGMFGGPPFPGSMPTTTMGEAVIFLGAWLALLFAGYTYHRKKFSVS